MVQTAVLSMALIVRDVASAKDPKLQEVERCIRSESCEGYKYKATKWSLMSYAYD